MSKEAITASIENLNALGKSTSRSSLASQMCYLDDVLDKLKCLGYHRDFCKTRYLVDNISNFPPLHRNYFIAAGKNQGEQFFYFSSLFAWLMKLSKHAFPTPGQFDDPNATSAVIGISKFIKSASLRNWGLHLIMGPRN